MTLQEQFDIEKQHLPKGWHWLMDILHNSIYRIQNSYLKLAVPTDLETYDKPDNPTVEFKINVLKEKFGSIRCYHTLIKFPHDWTIFDEQYYDTHFNAWSIEIDSYIKMIEIISGDICEVSGQRGKIRNINGWLKCLSDVEFAKL